jgi:DNA-binding response OmpR family regulator
VAKITVIEDNRVIAFLIDASLQAAGHLPSLYASGGEGLAAMRVAPPDLLILDVNLPDMSGFDVALTLRQDMALSHVPILLLTALNDMDSRVRGLEVADDYLTKPFEKRELLARVGALLRRSKRSSALAGRLELIGGAGAAVQVVALVHSQGALVFDDGVTVYFDQGRVIHVNHQQTQSAEAVVAEAFSRQQGSFRFEPQAPLPPATLHLDPMAVLLELTRLADEIARDAANISTKSRHSSTDTASKRSSGAVRNTHAKRLIVVPDWLAAETLLEQLRGKQVFIAREHYDPQKQDSCVVFEGNLTVIVLLHSTLQDIPHALAEFIKAPSVS